MPIYNTTSDGEEGPIHKRRNHGLSFAAGPSALVAASWILMSAKQQSPPAAPDWSPGRRKTEIGFAKYALRGRVVRRCTFIVIDKPRPRDWACITRPFRKIYRLTYKFDRDHPSGRCPQFVRVEREITPLLGRLRVIRR
jgi:hypothetical protein